MQDLSAKLYNCLFIESHTETSNSFRRVRGTSDMLDSVLIVFQINVSFERVSHIFNFNIFLTFEK